MGLVIYVLAVSKYLNIFQFRSRDCTILTPEAVKWFGFTIESLDIIYLVIWSVASVAEFPPGRCWMML